MIFHHLSFVLEDVFDPFDHGCDLDQRFFVHTGLKRD